MWVLVWVSVLVVFWVFFNVDCSHWKVRTQRTRTTRCSYLPTGAAVGRALSLWLLSLPCLQGWAGPAGLGLLLSLGPGLSFVKFGAGKAACWASEERGNGNFTHDFELNGSFRT